MNVSEACRVDLLGLLPLFRHREVDELSQLPVLGPLLAVHLLEEALAVTLVVLVLALEHVAALAEHVRALAVLHPIDPLAFVSANINVGKQILNLQGLSKVGIQCLCEFRATGGSNSPYATGSVATYVESQKPLMISWRTLQLMAIEPESRNLHSAGFLVAVESLAVPLALVPLAVVNVAVGIGVLSAAVLEVVLIIAFIFSTGSLSISFINLRDKKVFVMLIRNL